MLFQHFFLPSKLYKFCRFLLKNIILHQILHKDHKKKKSDFEDILTLQIP